MISTSTQEQVVIARWCCPFFVLCAVSGVPLSWSQTAGGDTVAWEGFEIMHRSYSMETSARRAESFTKWTRGVASNPVVNRDTSVRGAGGDVGVFEARVHEGWCRVDLQSWESRGRSIGEGRPSSPRTVSTWISPDCSGTSWLSPGRAAEEDVRSHQQSGTRPQRNVKRRRRKPEGRMRLKDPWSCCFLFPIVPIID